MSNKVICYCSCLHEFSPSTLLQHCPWHTNINNKSGNKQNKSSCPQTYILLGKEKANKQKISRSCTKWWQVIWGIRNNKVVEGDGTIMRAHRWSAKVTSEEWPKRKQGIEPHVCAKRTQFKDLEAGENFVCLRKSKSLFLFQEMQTRVEGNEVLQAMAGALDFTFDEGE